MGLFAGQMFDGDLDNKVACALDCIGKGAAALSEAGNAVYTMSHALQKQGISGLLQQEPWKEATPPAPTPAQSSRKPGFQFVPQDADEKRAILQLRLERAMQKQDMSRVQQLSRELDEIDGPVKHTLVVDTPVMDKPVVDQPTVDKSTLKPITDQMSHVRLPAGTPPPPANRRAAEEYTPPSSTNESAPMEATTQTTPTPFAHPSYWHGTYPPHWPPSYPPHWAPCYPPHWAPSYPPHWPPGYLSNCQPSRPPRYPPRCAPNGPGPMFGHAREFGDMGRFANPQTAVSSGGSARMTEEPLSRTVKSHEMVAGITTPQASRSVVAHDAVYLSQMTRLSAPSLHTNFVHSGSPPRVEEVYDMPIPPHKEMMSEGCPFRLRLSGNAERALPCLASSVTLPSSGGLSSGELLLEGPSSHASARGLFPEGSYDVSAGIEHPSARTLLLEMRQTMPDEKALIEKIPTQSPFVMPKERHQPYDSNDSVGSPLKGIFEVDTVLDTRKTADGTREFLIQWKGWGPKWNNWEPEKNILDRRLLRKFNKKKLPVEAASSQDVDDFNMRSKRRCAKQAAVKARVAARKEHEGDD